MLKIAMLTTAALPTLSIWNQGISRGNMMAHSRDHNYPAVSLVREYSADPCNPVKMWNNHQAGQENVNSGHQLVICAGEGTTATHGVAFMVAKAGYDVGHYHEWYNANPPDSLARIDIHNNKKISSKNAKNKTKLDAWNNARSVLNSLKPDQKDDFDFRIFDGVDAIADSPIPENFPFIFRAYPNAKVILSIRNTTSWVQNREGHGDPLPFQTAGNSFASIHGGAKAARAGTDHMLDSELLFSAYNTMVMCMVPKKQLLIVDLFEEGNKAQGRIKQFLKGSSS